MLWTDNMCIPLVRGRIRVDAMTYMDYVYQPDDRRR